MPNQIEKRGTRLLIEYLKGCRRKVGPRRSKTFDLTVDRDAVDAEIKTKGGSSNKLDFLSFTDKQYAAIKGGKRFKVFLVCGVKNPKKVEIFEFDSTDLRKIYPKCYTSYEYGKKTIGHLLSKKRLV